MMAPAARAIMDGKTIMREGTTLGLLDKAFGRESSAISLSKPEAYAAVAVAAVAADGDISGEELQRTAIDLATLRAFRKHSLRDLGETLDKVAKLIKRRGPGPVLEATKTVLQREERESAFFVAVDLALADGVVEKHEREFLEELQRTLLVEEALALKIVEVVQIKNRV